jgi:hypothetical protein
MSANTSRSILDAFTIFPFAIVLALALAESFKFVMVEEKSRFILWPKLYALASFLLLILPFYQGMNRYLLVTYGEQAELTRPHSVFLIIDGCVFMTQSALFFAMSRTLGVEVWKRFYWVVFTLLMLDSAWGLTVRMHAHSADTPLIPPWMWLNIVTGAFILLLIGYGRLLRSPHLPAAIGTLAMLLRTAVDYAISWNYYFPAPPPSSPAG